MATPPPPFFPDFLPTIQQWTTGNQPQKLPLRLPTLSEQAAWRYIDLAEARWQTNLNPGVRYDDGSFHSFAQPESSAQSKLLMVCQTMQIFNDVFNKKQMQTLGAGYEIGNGGDWLIRP